MNGWMMVGFVPRVTFFCSVSFAKEKNQCLQSRNKSLNISTIHLITFAGTVVLFS